MNPGTLASICLLIACAAHGQNGDLIRAQRAANAGQFSAAYKIWRPLAEQGHPEAQYNLGRMYARGDGVRKDYKEAYGWFIRSARQGHTAAGSKVALMYERGDGVKKDRKKAAYWHALTKARGRSPGMDPGAKPQSTALQGDRRRAPKTPLPASPSRRAGKADPKLKPQADPIDPSSLLAQQTRILLSGSESEQQETLAAINRLAGAAALDIYIAMAKSRRSPVQRFSLDLLARHKNALTARQPQLLSELDALLASPQAPSAPPPQSARRPRSFAESAALLELAQVNPTARGRVERIGAYCRILGILASEEAVAGVTRLYRERDLLVVPAEMPEILSPFGRSILPLLEELILNSEDPLLQQHAIETLDALPASPRSGSILVSCLQSAPANSRRKCLVALVRDPNVYPAEITRVLLDPSVHPSLRRDMLEWLASVPAGRLRGFATTFKIISRSGEMPAKKLAQELLDRVTA